MKDSTEQVGQTFKLNQSKLTTNRVRRFINGFVLLLLAGIVLTLSIRPVLAAVELMDYTVVSTADDILLSWSTGAEYDLARFDILCKMADEPESQYHTIGVRPAQGSPTQGANYYFLIDQGLTPGVSYCFRLREVTTSDEPGEVFDRCGYGLSITPTPTAVGALPLATTITSTNLLTGTTIFTGNATLTPVPVFFTPTPLFTVAPSGVITQPQFTPTPTVFGISPLPTPSPTQIIPSTTFTGSIPVLATPIITFTPTPFGGSGPVPVFTPAPTVTITATATATVTQTSGAAANNSGGVAGVNSSDPLAQAATTPGPDYLVVTATPTLAAITLAPTLTPLATVTAQPNFNLASMVQPSTQNVALLFLCFTFFGASGLGILGLLTSLLYMRSRSKGDRYRTQRRLS